MTLREVDGAIYEPVSLQEAKEHLRVTGESEDHYIEGLISAARMFVEHELDETFRSVTYDYYLDEFPSDDIVMPEPPLISVTHVKYYDQDNTLQTLVEDTDYRVDTNSLPGVIEVIDSWPYTYDRTSAVNIRFVSGYSDISTIDPMVLHCIKLKISLLFEDREGGNNAIEKGLEYNLNKLKNPIF